MAKRLKMKILLEFLFLLHWLSVGYCLGFDRTKLPQRTFVRRNFNDVSKASSLKTHFMQSSDLLTQVYHEDPPPPPPKPANPLAEQQVSSDKTVHTIKNNSKTNPSDSLISQILYFIISANIFFY